MVVIRLVVYGGDGVRLMSFVVWCWLLIVWVVSRLILCVLLVVICGCCVGVVRW